MGIVPSWPGEEIMPPQPMLAQTRTVLDAWLIERGAGHGDQVAAILHNGVTMLDLIFACGRLGAILAPLNWRLSRMHHDFRRLRWEG
jgi:fatty-acyl-CoA synthase